MPAAVDAVIAGGGLSGLSLAAHLAVSGWRARSVVVVDDGTRDPATLAWAFWSVEPGLLAAAVEREYDRLRVSTHGGTRVVPLGRYRYRLVRGDGLRRVVDGMLRERPGFRLMTGRVEEIRGLPGGAEVVVDGSTLRTRWAFDSVHAPTTLPAAPAPAPHAPAPEPAPASAHLAFTGWEVACERAVFDPDVPTFFDFRTPQPAGARFVYVLPVTERRALVEHTTFSAGPPGTPGTPGTPDPPGTPGPGGPGAGVEAIREYLADVLDAGPYQVIRTERGVLPLRPRAVRRARGPVLAIGAAGGLVKASTGYGFDRIQRDSAAIARSLARHDHPFEIPAPRRRHRFMDTVLLDVLARDAGQVPRAFDRLFSRLPAEQVLKFLDEDTTLAEDLRLMATLPPAPYLRAIARRALR